MYSTALSDIMHSEHIKKNQYIMGNENVNSDRRLNPKRAINTNRNTRRITNQHLHLKESSNKMEHIVELSENKYANPHEHLIMVSFSLQSVIIECILNRRLPYQ